MSIVSAMLDATATGINYAFPEFTKNNVRFGRPVGFEKGEPHFEQYAQPRGLAHFNVSKNISKPYVKPDFALHGKPGVVPLKSNQWGTHAGNMLFFGDQPTQVGPLAVPYYTETNMHQFETEEYNPSFPIPRDYNAGIRPTIQPLREHSILEPSAPKFRPQQVKHTHYRELPHQVRFLPDDEIVREVRRL